MITENLQRKIDRAIRLLQSVQKRYDGEIEIAYSGGKDSDVILQLAKEAGIRYRAIYKNTTIDPPGTWGHVREMGVEILRAKASFFHLVAQKGFPSRFSRFCCEKLKEYKVLDKSVIGVRKAESRKRNERYNEPTQCRYYGAKTGKNHVELIHPILEWTDEDVRDFIIDRKLKLAPIYYNGGGKSTYRNALAVCAALSPQGASALSSFRNIPR
nr:MAG TPA: phosphoadenosine-phosphosulfate reductase [Caudoviricetes sp.]